MEWRIDTSMVGEVKAADLKKTLEASRDHWLKTQGEAAGLQASATHGPGPDGRSDMAGAQAHAVKIGETAGKLKAAHAAKAATLAEAMKTGIDTACALAEMLGGIVTATIVGHDNERHQSGCGKRISVAVDQTWE